LNPMTGACAMPSASSVSRMSRRCTERSQGAALPDAPCPRKSGATSRRPGRRAARRRKRNAELVTPCRATTVRPALGPNSCTWSRTPPSWANAVGRGG